MSMLMSVNKNFVINVDQLDYNITFTLFANDEIDVVIESISSKHQYYTKKDAKDILNITTAAKMELDSKQFYDLIQKAFEVSDQNITYTVKQNGDIFKLNISWRLNEIISREFELLLVNANVTDAERMSKIMANFLEEKNMMKVDIINMAENKNEVSNRLKEYDAKMNKTIGDLRSIQSRLNNVVNVAIYKDDIQRDFDPTKPVIDIMYNKRYPNTKLYVHATICFSGGCHTIAPQLWSYGKTKTVGQTGIINNDDIDTKSYICVIEKHRKTGHQLLQLSFDGMMQYLVINPISQNHQTCSIIRVEEIINT